MRFPVSFQLWYGRSNLHHWSHSGEGQEGVYLSLFTLVTMSPASLSVGAIWSSRGKIGQDSWAEREDCSGREQQWAHRGSVYQKRWLLLVAVPTSQEIWCGAFFAALLELLQIPSETCTADRWPECTVCTTCTAKRPFCAFGHTY